MLLSTSEASSLRSWLISELPRITTPSTSTDVLADYVLFIIQASGPEEIRGKLVSALEEFSLDNPAPFVDSILSRLPSSSTPPFASNLGPPPSTVTPVQDSFPALPNPYRLLFLHLEPLSLFTPFFIAVLFPAWFMAQLVPPTVSHPTRTEVIGVRERMAIWQLGNCYGLLGLISAIVFRAVREALRGDPVAQEKIVRASFTALAIADITHIALTLVALPPELRWNPAQWNAMTIGNVPTVVVLFLGRMAWFAGIGRKSALKQKTA